MLVLTTWGPKWLIDLQVKYSLQIIPPKLC